MDFLEQLKTKLEGLSGIPSVIEIGTYNENANSIAVVPTPGSMGSRYADKGKIYPFNFQTLVHNKSNMAAYQMTQKIMNILDNAGESFVKSKTNSFTLLNITVTTLPNMVSRTDFGSLYTAVYSAELQIKGDGSK